MPTDPIITHLSKILDAASKAGVTHLKYKELEISFEETQIGDEQVIKNPSPEAVLPTDLPTPLSQAELADLEADRQYYELEYLKTAEPEKYEELATSPDLITNKDLNFDGSDELSTGF